MSFHRIDGPNFKTPVLIHKPARRNAEGQPCQLRLPCCNWNDATTVFCHLRMFGIAGMAEKPDDWCGVFACSCCHDALDRRAGNGLCGDDDILRALIFTLKIQFADRVFIPGPGPQGG